MRSGSGRHLEPVRAIPASPPALVVQLSTDELREIIAAEVRRALAERDASTTSSPVVDWIGAEETASMIGCSRDYLRRVEGLPRYGSRSSPRYLRSEVEAFLRGREGRPLRGGEPRT